MPCKPAKTFEEQVDILITNHGLLVEDRCRAIVTLSNVNYYHLRGYYIHWMDKPQLTFLPNKSFDMICSLHDFDEKLRLLVWPLIQRIELRIRTHLAYFLAHQYGPLSYLEESIYSDLLQARESISQIQDKINRSSEPFVKHHRKKYSGELPVWAAVELFSFGNLSKIFKNLTYHDKNCIAKEYYDLDGELVDSYLHSLLCVRNICAHSGRLYNKRLPVPIMISNKNNACISSVISPAFTVYHNNFYAMLFAIHDLTPMTTFQTFLTDLENLMQQYKRVVEPYRLGMPYNWMDALK